MKKRVWIPLGIAAVAAVIIALLPIAIERFAESWLRDQGVLEPSIENVDFNPFTGLLRVEKAALPGSSGERGEIGLIEIDLEPSALFARRALVARLLVTGARFDIRALEDGRYAIGGLTLPLSPDRAAAEAPVDEAAEPWGFGLNDANLQNVEIGFRDARFDSRLTLSRLTLDRIATWEPEAATDVSVDLNVDGAAVLLQAQAAPLASEPNAELKLKVENFSIGAYPALFEGTDLAAVEGALSLDLTSAVRYRQDKALAVGITGGARMDGAQVGLPTVTVSYRQLTWSGELNATMPAPPDAALDVSGTSALTVRDFALRQRDEPIVLVAFEHLEVGDVVIDDLDQIAVGRIDVQALELLRGADSPVWSIGATHVEGIRIGERSALAMDTASLEDSIVQIEREPGGQLKLVSAALAEFAPPALEDAPQQDPASAAAPGAADEPTTPLAFRIGALEIGGQSRVRFDDLAVTPPLSSSFAVKTLRVTGIDTAAPEQPIKLSFAIEQDDGATLAGEGEVRPFGEELVTDLEVTLDRLDLTQLSPYLPGYNIQRGRLDLKTRARLRGEALEVDNSLVIEKLKLAGKAAGEQGLLGEGMAMPLDVALDLLRDGDDRISLELPISGSLSDPEFDTGDIVRTAMQNALQKAAVSYVKNALQPLGTILFIGKLAGKAARPRFEPVTFDPGTAELTSQSRAYLDKIGTLLGERPSLSITFCGVSTLADRDYLISLNPPPEAEVGAGTDSESETPADVEPPAEAPPPTYETERLELARERGNAMQEYLVSSKGIDVERLFRCRPTLEADVESPPRVEITL